jgi:hypothetical protein
MAASIEGAYRPAPYPGDSMPRCVVTVRQERKQLFVWDSV